MGVVNSVNSAEKIHNFIVNNVLDNNVSFKSGQKNVRISKINDTDYTVNTDKVSISLSLTEKGIKINKFKENEEISSCVQRGVQSFLYQLIEKIKLKNGGCYGKK